MYGAQFTAPPVRRARVGNWIAAVLFVIAVAGGVLAGVSFFSLDRQVDSFQRVQVPGQGTVTFSQPGGYFLYFEGPGFNSLSSTGTVRVSITNDASGQPVSLGSLGDAHESYSFGGHSGQAVASFTITTPGRYVVTTGTPTSPAPADIALGPGLGSALATAIVGLVFGILALIAAVFLVIGTAVRRRIWAARLLAGGPFAVRGAPPAGAGPQQPSSYPGGAPAAPPPPQQPYGQYPGSAPNDPWRPAR